VIGNVDPVFPDLNNALSAHINYFGRKLECNEDLLDSAVNAAENAWMYEGQANLFELAAIYACRISQAHSFADGNKRTAFLVAISFLESNGIETSHYNQSDLVEWLVDVAEKKIDQKGFARRLRCASGFAAIVE
jgi:death on curing protein